MPWGSVFLAGAIYLNCTNISPREIGEAHIVLAGVSREFAEEMASLRREGNSSVDQGSFFAQMETEKEKGPDDFSDFSDFFDPMK
ncbi:MAG: hypothetical protein N2C14_34135 [Planctomycetales bacterium]